MPFDRINKDPSITTDYSEKMNKINLTWTVEIK